MKIPEQIELAIESHWNVAWTQGRKRLRTDDIEGSAQSVEQELREAISTALLAAEQRGMERAADKHAVLKSAAVELACSYQDWADMYYGIARECRDLETQETAAECSRDARKYLFAIIGDGTVEEHAAIRKVREERG